MESKELLNKLVDDICEDTLLNTLETVVNFQSNAKKILIEILEDEGATSTEIALANYFVEKYIDILNDITDDAFNIISADEIECIGDCEKCHLNKE